MVSGLTGALEDAAISEMQFSILFSSINYNNYEILFGTCGFQSLVISALGTGRSLLMINHYNLLSSWVSSLLLLSF